jgi:hypothetical protein
MPTSLQYPLERSRDSQRHWERLLRRYPMPHWSFGLVTTPSIRYRPEILTTTTITTMTRRTTRK